MGQKKVLTFFPNVGSLEEHSNNLVSATIMAYQSEK